ncbi:hypothetical protein ACFOD9_09505 [Novosphingobium bradum]|uniref:Glycosyltransferase RgtA/B/C/D-like domain-containing protein n=1 Tax=Novosphingobium bradum TaxID=1737444 RepID=A0ABV7IUR0_9SPHN
MASSPENDAAPASRPGDLLALVAGHRLAALALFALAAFATRCATFGDWNYEVDVQFYLLTGQRLAQGAVLYVDLWDRKPPALFLAYALAALLPQPMLAVQLAATACTALAAYGVQRIALPHAGAQGSLLAGLAYVVLVTGFGGASGQAAILFNPLLVACAWTIAASLPDLARGEIPRRVIGGMGCAGLAIAMKQSAALEGIGFGLAALVLAWRGGAPLPRLLGRAAAMGLAGAMPMVLAGAWYLAIGHFGALWQALVLSNAGRVYDDAGGLLARYGALLRLLAPALLFAGMGALAMGPVRRWPPAYALGACWLALAALGLLAYPALFLHYALPLIAPLCLMAAPFFARRDLGLPAWGLLAAAMLLHSGVLDLAARARSRAASADLLAYVTREAPDHRVLAWNFSPWLLALTGSAPPTPLLFAPHQFDEAEAASSGLDTMAEVRRVLAWAPQVVVMQEPLPARPLNAATVALVKAYVAQCPRLRHFTLYDHNGPQVQAVYSGCASAQSTGGATGR